MRLFARFITLLLSITAAACATQPPRFRAEAMARLDEVKLEGLDRLKAAEYASTLQAFLKGEALVEAGERDEAGRYYELTLLKAGLLEQSVLEEQARLRAEAGRLALERERAERELHARAEAERRERARAEAKARAEAAETERARKAKVQKEPQPVKAYTVNRGESLPLVASRPEVYGDRSLWPLIYRANRDQIRDPGRIWPGQVLKIPRNLGRDDLAEARRYAQEHPP